MEKKCIIAGFICCMALGLTYSSNVMGQVAPVAANAVVKFINDQLGGIQGHPLVLHTCLQAVAGDGQKCGQQMANDSDVKALVIPLLLLDNQAFYTRSIRPLLEKIEQELNHKVFGFRSPVYCEFNADAILRGDPLQQATVANIGIQNGSVTRNEQRDWLNLPPLEGLDAPLTPLNMNPAGGMPDANPSADPTADGNGD